MSACRRLVPADIGRIQIVADAFKIPFSRIYSASAGRSVANAVESAVARVRPAGTKGVCTCLFM